MFQLEVHRMDMTTRLGLGGLFHYVFCRTQLWPGFPVVGQVACRLMTLAEAQLRGLDRD